MNHFNSLFWVGAKELLHRINTKLIMEPITHIDDVLPGEQGWSQRMTYHGELLVVQV